MEYITGRAAILITGYVALVAFMVGNTVAFVGRMTDIEYCLRTHDLFDVLVIALAMVVPFLFGFFIRQETYHSLNKGEWYVMEKEDDE